jgi:hypothetical protein
LTALILDRASHSLHLELRTSGPGRYALRPEPRLVMPGLSATLPGDSTPFFRSDKVELALPWNTLRGNGSDISSVVLKSPDVDLPKLRKWLATLPPSTKPFRFPRLTRGLRVYDATIRGAQWSLTHFDLALPSLGDGLPMQLDADGEFARGADASKFKLALSATPSGAGLGMRIAHARIALESDGMLPSLTAAGSLLLADTIALDLRGSFQRVPAAWSDAIDSSFAKPGETPFAIRFDKGPPKPNMGGTIESLTAHHGYRLKFVFGDPKRQPGLTLGFEGNSGAILDAKLEGALSRWPDAWPGLPSALAARNAPIAFGASYQGPALMTSPIAFEMHRADAALKGNFLLEDLRPWFAKRSEIPLPPVAATMSATQLDIGGTELRGIRVEIRDDAPTTKAPAAGAGLRQP